MTTPEDEKLLELQARYQRAAHAMQTGVAHEMNREPGPTAPKHLRVGVNSALVSHGALVRLLLQKGLITEVEYMEACCEGMEDEVRAYEERLHRLFGGGPTKITLL